MTNRTPGADKPDYEAIRAAARHMYETSPATFRQVAAELNVTDRTLKAWSSQDGGWRKIAGPTISARAHALADRACAVMEGAGAGATDAERQLALATDRVGAAVDGRAEILARHREETKTVRGLINEAVRTRGRQDGTPMKMAVEAARALSLVQAMERKAWGFDVEEDTATVIVERYAEAEGVQPAEPPQRMLAIRERDLEKERAQAHSRPTVDDPGKDAF